MKNVLLLTHHLESFAGSEINIYELTIIFQKLGYNVEIGTFIYGDPIKELFQKHQLNVKNLFFDTLALKQYDLIWAQHAPTLSYVLFELSIATDKIIFSSLSPYEPLEVPPLYLDKHIALYLANSEETKKQMIFEGVSQEKIKILHNSVISTFFTSIKKEYNSQPKKIAVISNHIPVEIYEFKEVAENNEFQVDLYGLGNKVMFITPELLLQYDLLITIGKTVQMGLSLGIPVYVYDHFGGDGWVTCSNLLQLERNNFSGRTFQKKLSGRMIFDEIYNSYFDILQDVDKLKSLSKRRYDLENNVKKIVFNDDKKSIPFNNINDLQIVHRTLKCYTRLLQNFISLKEENTKLHIIKEQQLQQKEQIIQEKNQQLQQSEQIIQEKNQQLQQKEQIIQEKDKHLEEKDQQIQHLHDIAQSMRIKNRLKRAIQKVVPSKVWKLMVFVKDNPSAIKEGVKVVKKDGVKVLFQKMKKVDTLSQNKSANSYKYIVPILTEEIRKELASFSKKPLISIIMPVYNVDPKWLNLAIKSIENQWYKNWELCIADDKSTNQKTIDYLKSINHPKIKIKFLEKNLNISAASNAALELATGEYVALMDNDDEITPDALYEILKVINEKDVDFIYSDEDKLELDGTYTAALFKPDFSYDLLLSLNYITHLAVIKKELLDSIDGFNVGVEGAQDHDLFLHIVEKTEKIVHIPKVLYHWRMLETSTAKSSEAKPYAHDAAKQAIQSHLDRSNIKAKIKDSKYTFVFDIDYILPEPKPLVSIIIPTKDGVDLLDVCIKSILEISTYKNYEIIILNNNSEKPETFEWFKYIEQKYSNIKVIDANYEFNWSKLNNHGIGLAKGEVYIFLNNDIKVITSDWIEKLAGKALQPKVGTVGALLLFEDNTIQHAGVVLGMNGWADHVYRGVEPIHKHSPYISPMVTRNVLASTGACLAISKKVIDEIGGFDEQFLICGSDVEICLRAYENGYRNIFDATTRLYHFESKTRDSFVPKCDFKMSKKVYEKYWENGDPFYNKNLKLDSVIPAYKG